jgi:hypothetical protein
MSREEVFTAMTYPKLRYASASLKFKAFNISSNSHGLQQIRMVQVHVLNVSSNFAVFGNILAATLRSEEDGFLDIGSEFRQTFCPPSPLRLLRVLHPEVDKCYLPWEFRQLQCS